MTQPCYCGGERNSGGHYHHGPEQNKPVRYVLYGFGGRAAANNTMVCEECGAVVYLRDAHDRFHERLEFVEGKALGVL
jgi:hypothetical protein